jgi:hypothetical protein
MSTRKMVAGAVVAALTAAASNPANSLEKRDVSHTAEKVIANVVPMVEHVTNQEPWYQSRVTWGAIVSTAIPILGAFGVATDWIEPDEAVAFGVALGSLIGGVITIYGRWRAKKPLGQ